MSCMSAYSMPLWIILTKWPAPSVPTWVTHGSPSTTAAIEARIGPSVSYASAEPPGMIEGPLSAPSSPPEIPAPTKLQPLRLQRLLAPDRVVEVGVAAVDDDVTLLEQLGELVDDGVGARAGLHHDDRGARLRQRRDEVLDRRRRRRTRRRGARRSSVSVRSGERL